MYALRSANPRLDMPGNDQHQMKRENNIVDASKGQKDDGEEKGDKQEKAERIRGNNRFSRSIILPLFSDKTVFFISLFISTNILTSYLKMTLVVTDD
jgi:hypothetical protein